MNPVVSIIIPCYNSGKYLPEALKSIEGYRNQHLLEIIIVNDGSNDPNTLQFLNALDTERYLIISQKNGGPAAARNKGVSTAKGEFLLFLDSDNKIRPDYIDEGIDVLRRHTDVGIVYSNASFFGDSTYPRFKSKQFDIYSLLMRNYIDVCAVIRRKSFLDVNGFDENRILFGHEDWELWIRLYKNGWKFYYIDKVLFDYRIRNNSLWMQKSESENAKDVTDYVYKKHLDMFLQYYEKLYFQRGFYMQDKQSPFRTFIKNVYRKYIDKKPES